jgi:hypothetical protein
MPDGGFPLKLCRSCNRTSRDVHFDRMSKHRCTECADGAKQRRAERIEVRGPRVAEAVRDPDPGENAAHLKWIRKLPCAVHGPDCCGPVHAHHVRENTGAGTGLKPADMWAVPLCGGGHHLEFHRIGAQSFAAKHGIDLRSLAVRLAAASPHIKRTTERSTS